MDHQSFLKRLGKILQDLRSNEVLQKAFKKYNLSMDELDTVPICLSPLDVSARTAHGIIYLNEKLIEEEDDVIAGYLVHELTHYAQQTSGEGPTQGSTDKTYLDNPAEIEGFNFQSEFIAENEGDDAAKDYIDQVLDHHKIRGKERKRRTEQLLQLSEDSK